LLMSDSVPSVHVLDSLSRTFVRSLYQNMDVNILHLLHNKFRFGSRKSLKLKGWDYEFIQ